MTEAPQNPRVSVIEDIVQFNRLLRTVVEAAAKWRDLNDDNVAKLREFIEVAKVGDKPSDELARQVAQAFDQFLEKRGTETLDQLLGPIKRGQGQREFFAGWEKLERDAQLMLRLYRFTQDGCSDEAAANAVVAEYSALPIVHGRPVIPRGKYFDKPLSGETLRNEYRRLHHGQCWADIIESAISEN